ncbi:MAG: tetratricopeptide repeat protein [Candidatus Theseobacter exili]|nr:tetratricopeptide repeat protein [Candidatus Theseobacter exili]
MKKRIVLLLFITFVSTALAQDKIHLKSGEVIEGKILSNDDNSIEVEIEYGVVTIEKDQIKGDLGKRVLSDDENIYQLIKNKNFKKALKLIRKLIKHSNSSKYNELTYLSGICYLNLGQLDKASKIFMELLLKEPSTKWALYSKKKLFEIAVWNKNYNRAFLIANDLINKIEKEEKDSKSNEIEIQKLQLEEYLECKKKFNEIKNKKWNYKNLILYDQVIKDAKKIIKQKEKSIISIIAKRIIYESLEMQAEYRIALEYLQKYIIELKHWSISFAKEELINKISESYKLNRYQQAINFYRMYANVFNVEGGECNNLSFQIGMCCYRLNDYSSAIQYFRKNVFCNSGISRDLWRKSFKSAEDSFFLKKDFNGLIDFYERIEHYNNSPNIKSEIGFKLSLIYILLDDEKTSIIHFRKVNNGIEKYFVDFITNQNKKSLSNNS